MSPRSGHDEFERVLRTMRDRLSNVSHEISELLGKLEWEVEAAGPEVRNHARDAAADVVRTQEWLNHRMSQLPLDPGQRYAAMQEMLQVQFVALQKVSSIINDVLIARDRMYASHQQQQQAMLLQQQTYPQPILPPPAGAPQVSTFDLLPLQPPQPHSLFPLPQHHAEPRWDSGVSGLHDILQVPPPAAAVRLADLSAPPQDTPRTGGRPRGEQTKGRSTKTSKPAKQDRKAQRGSSRRLAAWSGLLLCLIAVLGVAGYYVGFGRIATRISSATNTAHKRVSLGDPAARDQALANAGAQGNPATRVPSPPPMAAPPLEDAGSGAPRVPGLMVVQPQVPRSTGSTQSFVAVVATHRDKQALAKIYNDLRRQYPAILGPRRADAQSVNLGDSGVWHHLVLLPAGPREDAQAICSDLRAAGYPRCMVRPY